MGNTSNDFRNHLGNRYVFEVSYFDENGNNLNSEIVPNSQYYQTFFTVDNYMGLSKKNSQIVDTENNGGDLFKYTYRDTNPHDKMIGEEGVVLAENRIGLKGYMGITKYNISYYLKINLFEANTETFKQNSNFKFYELPTDNGLVISSIKIPIDVIGYLPSTDQAIEELNQKFATYFGVTVEDFVKSED